MREALRSCISIVLIFFLQHMSAVDGQAGSFPPTENVGLHKPISTNGEKTCGSRPDQSSYCEPVKDDRGLANQACNRRACNLECPGRDRESDGMMPVVNVMDGNLRNCITRDFQDNRGKRKPAFRFINHPTCFANPREALELGFSPGQFTVAVWIKQAYRNAGVIVEKVASPRRGMPRQIVFSILVGAYSVVLQYRGVDSRTHIKVLRLPFPPAQWHHFALQVYNTTVSAFLDGVGSDGTPILTEQLDAPLADLYFTPVVKIGQRMQGTGQFIGMLQDYRWYKTALTNREIQEIYSEKFEELNIQSNCLCPRGYPRVHPLQERYCIPNGEPDTTEDRRLRLNENAYPLEYINDGDYSTTWISTNFYMRGGVTMTFDLENGEYEIFSIIVQFWNPQPQAITISRLSNRTTEGTMKIWGYFADDCLERFSMTDNGQLKESDSFNCLAFPEKENIPHLNNNITFNLLSDQPFLRPGKDDFYNNPVLMDFVKAEKIGFRMQYQYFTAKADVDVGHQIYAIREMQIVGRCNCHGHADACDMTTNPYECKCIPRSNTAGNMCEQCLPLYNNKPFRKGTNTEAFDCQPCECYGHADSCHYDETLDSFPNDFYQGGGGRCDNCQHHTTGINCELCAEFYFRIEEVPLDDSNVCLSCECELSGVVNGTMDCEKINGQCDCKRMVLGRTCSTCIDGYYNLLEGNPDGCETCDCHLPGTIDRDFTCEQVGGQCRCKVNIEGRTCSECKPGFKNLMDSNEDGCEPCNCHNFASEHQYCNSTTGNCKCKENIEGMYCDVCMNGFWKLPDSSDSQGCESCNCDESGTVPGTVCNKESGQCVCKANTEGRTCNVCKDIYFSLDATNEQGCQNCHCDPRGTVNGSLICDKESGQCRCKANVEGRVCNECKGNTFGLNRNLEEGCQPCDCDPSGTQLGNQMAPNELVCHATTGQCACTSYRQGRRCDQCEPEYYLPPNGEPGCLRCDCHPYASMDDNCDNSTGQCMCKEDAGLTGRTCSECQDTFWNFNHLLGSCEDCGCDERGRLNSSCDAISGVCSCKGNVVGDKCDQCREGSSVLKVENPMGCYSHPEQQAPPIELRITSSTIDLEWNPPDLPNGDELQYQLYRNSELILDINDTAPFSTMHFNDTNLLPYTDYDYYIEASNLGGTTSSTEASFKTLAGIPTGIPPLEVTDITSDSATFEWGEPEVAHGPIEQYVLQSVDAEFDRHPKEHYSGLDMKKTIEGLRSFVNYTFTLRACTTGGCGDSLPVIVITPEAKPEKQKPPTIIAISNTSLLIEWERPEEPNGILLSYKVLWRGNPDANGVHHPMQAVAFEDYGQDDPRPKQEGYSPLEPLETNFTIDGLQPYTEYQFLVSSANSAGSTDSTWATGRTLEGTPLFIDKPRARAVSSSEVNLTWIEPDLIFEVRGKVKMYQVIWVKNNTDTEYNLPPFQNVVLYSTGPRNQHYLARNLEPYVYYTFFINLCNSVTCVESERITVRTLPAAPEGQDPPTQDGKDSHSISLSWKLPKKVNGPAPKFTLLKSPVAFSSPPTEMSRGIRFPGKSYLRYSKDILPKDASYSGIQLKFRTHQENAVLFYAASKLATDYTRHEYLVIQLRDGRPWFLFDLQNSPTSVTIDNDDINARYNDGKWHRVEVNRFEQEGFIEIDGVYTGSGKARGTATVYGSSEDIFIGGLPRLYDVARPHDRGSKVVVAENFVGCIKDISVQRTGMLKEWSNVTFDEAEEVYRTYDAWQGCPDVLDVSAAHFLGRGYLVMKNVFTVSNSNTWGIRMQIRPAFPSGILFYAAGKRKNFIMGTINNGTLRFIISMGDDEYQELTLNSTASSISTSLCGGDWHTAEFRNSNGRMTIGLDDHLEIGPLLDDSYKGIDLSKNFYIGGIDEHLTSESSHLMKYFEDDGRSFGGCMRALNLNLIEKSLSSEASIAYNVDLDGCPVDAHNSHVLLGSGSWSGDSSGANSGNPTTRLPTDGNSVSKPGCQDSSLKVIYEGYGMADNSTELNSYSQYLYRIMASNDGGDTRSDWKIMRSGEGIPEKVGSPYDARHISGYVVEVFWRRPYHSKGVIVNYTLTAIPLDEHLSPDNYTINATFDGEMYVGNITNLEPWSGYDVYLSACTEVGCTRSTGSYEITTNQEAPYFVKKPSGAVTRNTMTLSWAAPDKPNGIIVNYTLFHNNSIVYSGMEMQHTIGGLATFQQQRFKVEACTLAGCKTSEEVTIHSSQLPPGHVDPPMLKVLGPNSVAVEWLQPAVLNGVFQRYAIYLSNEEGELGEVVYNSTDPFVETEFHSLTAGKEYFVTLEACTGGGCKRSSQSYASTTESIPEDVPKPEVISRSPFSFDVTWTEPSKANGVITNYSLYMNDALRYTTLEPSSRHIEMLSPYSRHTFRLEVCTMKGCAFSPLAVHRTQESKPEGGVTVSVTVVDSRSLDAKWNMPMKQNGVMNYTVLCTGLFFFDAQKRDFREVYESRILHIGDRAEEWVRIEGLLPYTRYMIQVNASNSKGYIMSNMRTVSMPPGAPDGVEPPDLVSTSPYDIVATWKDPVRNNAPGNAFFQLQYRRITPLESEKNAFDAETRQMSYSLKNLQPNEGYEFRLICFNSFGETESEWASIHTQQTSPGFLAQPHYFDVDSWSLSLRWRPPTSPNGIIQNYTIYEDGEVVETLLANETYHLIENLKPFTRYNYVLEACNTGGCTRSDVTTVQTTAAAPEGLAPPEARSESPTSVFVTWKQPKIHNGILDNYILERRPDVSPEGNDTTVEVTILGSFVPSQSLRYLDDGGLLQPFTSYQYRITSSTIGGGSTTSNWTTIRTRAGRPGGLSQPDVTVLSPRSALVEWTAPSTTNGPIIKYEVLFPDPQYSIDDNETFNLTVDELIPYTEYQVSVIACTDGGCTESLKSHITTQTTVPEDLDPPVAIPISESYISVQWKPPKYPNGPGIFYELARTKLEQPLAEPTPNDIGVMVTIYVGTDTSFQDRELEKHTKLSYMISCFNVDGSVTSNATEVTTLGGVPINSPQPKVSVVNHTSVRVMWTTPSLPEIQGAVKAYIIEYETDGYPPEMSVAESTMRSIVLTDLHPGMNYSVVLTVDNGAHNISSEPTFVQTKDGAPEDVLPPVVYSLSASELHISWLAPLRPNGEIIEYSIYLDNMKITMNTNRPSSYVLSDLQPFTIYNLQLEACTKYACAKSETTKATTQETIPEHFERPIVKILGANKVEVIWVAPKQPNGILKSYEVHRRSLLPCSQMETGEDGKVCSYVKCRKSERPCGNSCYSPSLKVCCDGNLFFRTKGFECCGDRYIRSRKNVSDVCCAGKFFTVMKNYKCCGKRYVQVLDGEVCCEDDFEDRVSVGTGDSCCGVVPFYSRGVQICCGRELHDGFKKKCCGGELIDAGRVCCGDEDAKIYDKLVDHHCCGSEYVSKLNSVCCRDSITGKEAVHRFDKLNNEGRKCCSTQLIPNDMKCCNGRGYISQTHVCADVGTISYPSELMRCGTGAVCSINQAPNAFCDRCDFDLNVYDCFVSKDMSSKNDKFNDEGSLCPTSFVTVYSGPADLFSFTDETVDAYTRYEYKVLSSNKMGSAESEIVAITTFQSIPEGIDPPDWTSNNKDTIMLSWKEPKKPNGVVTRYVLVRDGLEIWRGESFRHTDSFQIRPFRRYEYVVKACTYVGCGSSPLVYATSIQGVPSDIQPPLLTVESPYNISVTWTAPSEANGLIISYILNETDIGTIYRIDPVEDDSLLSYSHEDLDPYSTHTYTLTACTIAGCSTSDEVTVTTSEAKPDGVWLYPAALPINMSTVELYWNPPKFPNGIIREYRLLRRKVIAGGIDESVQQLELIYQGGPEKLNYTDTVPELEMTYEYELLAINEAGFGRSKPHRVKMPRVIPQHIPALDVRVTGAQTLFAEWSLGEEEFPATYRYSIIVRPASTEKIENAETGRRAKRSVDEDQSLDEEDSKEEPLLIYSVGNNQTYVIEKLSPYTLYRVRVRTCLPEDEEEIDCVTGDEELVRTLPADPQQQPKPQLKAVGPRIVDVTWEPPRKPNGILSQYQIYRRKAVPQNSQIKLIFSTGDMERNWFTDSDPELSPYTRYEYRIRVRNSVGFTESPWAHVTTLQDTPQGVSTPTVTPISAYAVRVLWSPPEMPNGNIISYSLEYSPEVSDPASARRDIDTITVPSTLREAHISGLKPFTTYEVRLVVANGAGMEARSDWVTVKTSSAPPSGVGNFSVSKTEDGRSLLLRWDPPAIPNGEITNYNVYEYGDETPLQSGLFRQFHFRRLKPYTNYTLLLEACSGHNLCTTSPPQTFTTAETVPDRQAPPTISLANTTAVTLFWTRPKEANGVILSYKVIRNEIPRSYSSPSFPRQRRSTDSGRVSFYMMDLDMWVDKAVMLSSYPWESAHTRIRRASEEGKYDEDGSLIIYEVENPSDRTYNYTDSELKPFTKYEYKIRTTTKAGYVDSDWMTAETHQASPAGLSAPEIIHTPDRSPTELIVRWNLPEKLNGILQTFRVQRNNSNPLSFPTNQFQFTDKNLKPYTLYSYSVTACTSGGCTESPTRVERTLEEAPLFVSPPVVVSVNSSALHVEWSRPTITNGVIRKYQVLINDNIRYEGLAMEATVGELAPYTLYEVKVAACTSSGCRTSGGKSARTDEAPPQLMAAPELHVTSPHSIEVNWEPPIKSNGKIIRYELRRNNEVIFVADGNLRRYHDFELKPGTTYTYVVNAFNKRGSVQSSEAIEVTDPAAPAGLAPPDLTASSSSSIHASWHAPASPNGIIVNFTLYVRSVKDKADEKIIKLPGNVYEHVVRGLMYYEDYSFWLQSCTELGCVTSERTQHKTLEGIPSDQKPPHATLANPDDIKLHVTWDPPDRPYGKITMYELHRRRIIETESSIETVQGTMVYNGTARSYTDKNLVPYTKYQYKVVARNAAGEARSDWSSLTRTGEAAPENMAAPSFGRITERSVQVIASEPSMPNGDIRTYTVYARRNQSYEDFEQVTTGYGRDQTAVGLQPFTPYEFRVEACTLDYLCLKSPTAYTITMPAPPKGQNAPLVVSVFSNNVTLQWSAPAESNGIISSYEVHTRKTCPSPYQPFKVDCVPGAVTVSYPGISQHTTIDNLTPYESYGFRVVSINDYGRSESDWTTATTLSSAPVYVAPMSISSNISSIYVEWRNSFKLNSILVQYELTDRGRTAYTGFDRLHRIRRTAAMVHEFQVKLTTDTGTVISPIVMHDTGRGSSYLPGSQGPSPLQPNVASAAVPVYETIWFIAVVVLIAIMLIFTVLGVIMRKMSSRYSDPLKLPIPSPASDKLQFSGNSTSGNSLSKLQRDISHRSMPTSSEQNIIPDSFMDTRQFQNEAFEPDWSSKDNANVLPPQLATRREKTPFVDTHL